MEIRGQIPGVCFLLLLCGAWGQNSSCQAWCSVSLPTDLSYQPAQGHRALQNVLYMNPVTCCYFSFYFYAILFPVSEFVFYWDAWNFTEHISGWGSIFSLEKYIYLFSMCVCACACACACQRTTCRHQFFFPFILWVPGIELTLTSRQETFYPLNHLAGHGRVRTLSCLVTGRPVLGLPCEGLEGQPLDKAAMYNSWWLPTFLRTGQQVLSCIASSSTAGFPATWGSHSPGPAQQGGGNCALQCLPAHIVPNTLDFCGPQSFLFSLVGVYLTCFKVTGKVWLLALM